MEVTSTFFWKKRKSKIFLEIFKIVAKFVIFDTATNKRLIINSLRNLEILPKLSTLPSFCFSCCAENENMNNSLHELEQKQQQKRRQPLEVIIVQEEWSEKW